MSEKKGIAYSQHLLFWSFQFGLERQKTFERYTRDILNIDHLEIDDKDWNLSWERYPADNKKVLRENYALWQYMSGSARKIFGGFSPSGTTDSADCQVYRLALDEENPLRYVVKKDDEDFELSVQSVELHLYAFGFGVLIFHMVNEGHPTLSDTKKIADYCRRIRLPFFPADKDGYCITADSISLMLNGHKVETDFRAQISAYNKDGTLPDENSERNLNGFFKKMVEVPGVTVVPQVDDRMFEMELIRDAEFSKHLEGKSPGWRQDDLLLETLYPLVYVDGDGRSCYDAEMLQEQILQAIYPRWIGYGTIYAATEYSALCITNDDATAETFLHHYHYMVSLVLAQRSCLFQFAERADEENIRPRRLAKLKGEYDQMYLKMMIARFSDQDQGVELYQLLQTHLGIPRYQEAVRQQLSNAFEAAALALQDDTNKRLSYLGIIIAFLQVVIAIITWLLQK